jgi:hypothetical protein
MQELLGRLTALDPEASETLKVVSYFDALVANGVGLPSLVRGAAALAGVPVGCSIRDRATRMSAVGERLPAGPASSTGWMSKDAGGGVVWIEREGRPHVNDAMVLERLSIAIAITTARHADGVGAVETALSGHSSDEERHVALARLRLDTVPVLRAIASTPDVPAPPGAATSIIVTPWGPARAVLGTPATEPPAGARAGIGVRSTRERVHESWRSALVSLRLTTPSRATVDAEELGVLLVLADAADARAEPVPDVAALEALDPRSLDLLDAIADLDSMRAAASRLGLHHSTVQQQSAALSRSLGYDPRTPSGRVRYTLARTLQRLSHPIF